MKIESTDQDIRTLLSSGYYRIPRFQRPYSWDRENIQEFWDDIVKDNSADYFIGSIVVYKQEKQHFGVVDGQQRLTTITILLCVLRNKLLSLGFEDLAEGMHGLVERKNVDNQSEFIVSTESSYPFFQDRIQKRGNPEIAVEPLKEERSLQEAFDQLGRLVDAAIASLETVPTLSEPKKTESAKQKLVAVRDALLNLKVIFIRLDDEDDAYIIFETLNTRGKDLSLKDLVKNHLTKHLKAKNPATDQAKVKWGQLLETIEGSSADLETDTFLHHFWLSKYDYLPAKTLFKVLKKSVGPDEACPFLDSLLKDAALYRAIHEVSYGKWSKEERRIQDSLLALSTFRVVQQAPCVLSLMREYRIAKKLKKKHVEDALVAIEKFHFLFTAITSQRSSGGISAMYAALGRRLSEAKTTQESTRLIAELKQKLRDRVPSAQEFKALFPTVVYTDNVTKQKKLAKYILVGLARLEQSPIVTDYDQMTIEHLAPQSLIGTSGYTDAIIGQVGNLLLVSEATNGKLKNKPFKEKKRLLREAKFPLPAEVQKAHSWGVAEIQNRTELLAGQAFDRVWKI